MSFRPIRYLGSSLLVLGLLVPSAQAASDWKTYPGGKNLSFLGLDDTSAPTQAEDGRASDLNNVTLDISKAAQQRFGYSLVGNTLDIGSGANAGVDEDFCAVTGLYYTKFSSGTERIVSTCGNRFTYLNGSSWDTVSGITVAITAGQNNQFVWTTALDEIFGTNNVDLPLRYDGTSLSSINFSSLTASERPTTVKTLAFFKNFLVVCNTTENGFRYPTRCRWSNVGTTATWSDDDFIDIGALGGQEINALAELYDNLYVFLTDSIYRVSFVAGADTFNISKVTDDIGAIAKNSVQSITLSNAQQGLVFLDKDKKVYFFNGIVVQDISQLIQQTLSGWSASRLQYAVSADTNTDYLLCATNGTGGVNNQCLDLEYQIGEWTKHQPIPANAMAHVLDANGRDQVYFGSTLAMNYRWANSSLRSDVGTASGTVDAVDRFDTDTASGLLVLYDDALSLVTGSLVGAPMEITAGPGIGLTGTVAYNTVTGLVVVDDFSTTPTVTSSIVVGVIDSFYTTKWYDLGEPARLKHFGEVYFWAEEENSSMALSHATDLNTDISTQDISLNSDADDAVWGSAIWGTSLWGSSSDVFRQAKIDGAGRYLRIKFAEDDPDETWHLFGWTPLYRSGDVN